MAVQADRTTEYYARRAEQYERIYTKPERQADLALMRSTVAAYFSGRRVLDVACGTGYWTVEIAATCQEVLGFDINQEMLDIAQTKPYPNNNAHFRRADLYAPVDLGKPFNGGLAAHWWSHIDVDETDTFFNAFHAPLGSGARVLILDNRFVTSSSTPISRTDEAGNTFQVRHLDDGTEFEVLKNFPTRKALLEQLAPYALNIDVQMSEYYWWVTYQVRQKLTC